jgi:hypothetical protein
MTRQVWVRGLLLGAVAGVLASPALGEEAPAAPDFDATFSLTAASDYFSSGLTQSDNQAVLQPQLELFYGAFYASAWASNVDYGKGETADAELEFIAGVAPTVGAWTFDLSVTSYQYPGDAESSYTYGFGSATYAFDSGLSLGAGYAYYWYDEGADYSELYAAIDYAFASGLSLHGETSYDIDYDGAGNDYVAVEGGVVVPLPLGLEASANLGYEGYLDDPATPSYLWYDAGITYAFNDWASLDVRYYGNDLSDSGCAVYTATNCTGRVVAALTVSESLSSFGRRTIPAEPVQPDRPLAQR